MTPRMMWWVRVPYWVLMGGILFVSQAQSAVILHAFNWKYSEVTRRASEIARLGYRKVLVSPPLLSQGKNWYMRYQPQDYRVIHNPLGNTHDVREMLAALQEFGVDAYADIVLNHMANDLRNQNLKYPCDEILPSFKLEDLINGDSLEISVPLFLVRGIFILQNPSNPTNGEIQMRFEPKESVTEKREIRDFPHFFRMIGSSNSNRIIFGL